MTDFEYLEQAEAHADEGPLGEPASLSILKIALRQARDNIALRGVLSDVCEAIRELRLADAHAARTGSEARWDRALTAVCQFENRIQCALKQSEPSK